MSLKPKGTQPSTSARFLFTVLGGVNSAPTAEWHRARGSALEPRVCLPPSRCYQKETKGQIMAESTLELPGKKRRRST